MGADKHPPLRKGDAYLAYMTSSEHDNSFGLGIRLSGDHPMHTCQLHWPSDSQAMRLAGAGP